MALKQQIDADLKSALLAGDRERAEVLRGLKSAILYEEVALKKRDPGLSDEEIQKVIARECKKRDEAADLYEKGERLDSAAKERREKEVLSIYLPKQLSDEELGEIVGAVIEAAGEDLHMGKLIGAVKQQVDNRAEGARVAAAVQKALR
ncbi:MAG TPA: GatB/YqeY domain-containing protein [Candidatus Saccharimonadales bacterium]